MLRALAPLPSHAAARYAPVCGVGAALRAVGGRWSPAVVGRLARGAARFSALREATGASAKALTADLRRLEAAGVVVRDARGPGVSYRLSASGRALVPVLDALGAWAGEAGLMVAAAPAADRRADTRPAT